MAGFQIRRGDAGLDRNRYSVSRNFIEDRRDRSQNRRASGTALLGENAFPTLIELPVPACVPWLSEASRSNEADHGRLSAADCRHSEPRATPPFGFHPGRKRTTADGDSRSRVPSCGRRYADAPTAVPFTVSGGGEFPPSYARQSSVVTDARRTAVYTPFFLSAPTVPARRSMRYNDDMPAVLGFAGKP